MEWIAGNQHDLSTDNLLLCTIALQRLFRYRMITISASLFFCSQEDGWDPAQNEQCDTSVWDPDNPRWTQAGGHQTATKNVDLDSGCPDAGKG